MDPRVEQLLMARAIQEAEDKPSLAEAATIGAIPGSIVGAVAGTLPHKLGTAINDLRGNPAAGLRKIKPGYRTAGGLVGAILGGSLGAGTRQMMIQNSPTAQILGKIQSGQELNEYDQRMLASLITDTYVQMGLR